MPFNNTNRALSLCIFPSVLLLILLCCKHPPHCSVFSFRGFRVLCSVYKAFGSRQNGWHGSVPPIYCLSVFFHWLPLPLYSFPPLIYLFSTQCSWGSHSVPLSSSSRVSQLPGLPASAWTDRPQTLHESLSGNSGNCSLLSLEYNRRTVNVNTMRLNNLQKTLAIV